MEPAARLAHRTRQTIELHGADQETGEHSHAARGTGLDPRGSLSVGRDHAHRLPSAAPLVSSSEQNTCSTSAISCSLTARDDDDGVDPRATRATSTPRGSGTSAIAARSTRFARFRCTAPPTRRDATTATRAASSSCRSATCITTSARESLRPRRSTRTTSRPFLRRSCATSRSRPSGRELLATLATPVVDDRPSLTGPHAGPEAVLPGAAAVVGLEGALHGVLRCPHARDTSAWTRSAPVPATIRAARSECLAQGRPATAPRRPTVLPWSLRPAPSTDQRRATTHDADVRRHPCAPALHPDRACAGGDVWGGSAHDLWTVPCQPSTAVTKVLRRCADRRDTVGPQDRGG